MDEQLFTDYGRVRPTRVGRSNRRPLVCAFPGCTNLRRNVQAAKYCEEHATCINYQLSGATPVPITGSCLVCGATVTQRRQLSVRSLLLCKEHGRHRHTLNSWQTKYGLTNDRITDLLTDPRCWVCRRSLAWFLNSFGGNKTRICVDHDHRCCNGEGSCGECVRGLVHERCNIRLGHLEKLLADIGSERGRQLINELLSSDPPSF